MDIFKTKGSPEDKVRLFLVFYLSQEAEMSKEESQEYEKALQAAGCDNRPLEFAKRYRSNNARIVVII